MSLAGNIADMGIALQATKGTPAATAQHRMRVTGPMPMPVRDVEDIVETTGQRMREGSFVARIRFEGSVGMVARPTFLGLLLYGAMGTKSVTGSADPWTHTFKLAAALPWLTVWTQLSNGQYVRATDCKVTGLRIESSAGGVMMVTATIMGRSFVNLASATWTTQMAAVTPENANPYLHADGAGALKVEGTAVTRIERAAIEIDNTGAMQYGDNITPENVTEALQTITAEVVENIVDFALWNRMVYGSATPADLATPARDPLELAGSPAGIDFKWLRPGSPARSLEILLPRIQLVTLAGVEPNTDGNPIKQTATYRAYKPAVAADGMTAILQNGNATYPAI